MLVIAIDPGAQGALCSLDTYYKHHTFQACPNLPKISIGNVNTWLSCHARGAACIVIEDVHSMHNMSAKSNFQFGRNLGMIEALAYLHAMDVSYIQPKEWQKLCGINFEYPKGATVSQKSKIRKETTATRCLELYPNAAIYGPKGGLKDGRTDALMIAHAMTIKLGDPNGST